MNDSRPPSADSSRRSATDSAAVFLLDAAGRVIHANHAARALWQAGDESLAGESFPALFAFDIVSSEPDFLEAQWDVILDSARNRDATLAAQPRSGAPCDVRVRLEQLPDDSYLAVVATAPAAAPAAAPATEGAFALLADKGAAGFFDLDLKSGRVFYSPSWKKILGYVDAELPDTIETWRELIHPDDSAAAPDQLARKHASGSRPFSVEFRMRHRLGHWVWIQSIGVQLLSPAGELERVVGLHLDITERKDFEESSLANDERLELLGGVGPLGAFDLNFAAGKFWLSPVWKKTLGYRADELPDDLATFATALPPDESSLGVETWFLLRAPGKSSFVERVVLVGKNGTPVPVLLATHRVLTRKRDLARAIGFICAAPGAATDAAATEGPLFDDAFAALAEGVLVTDATGKILRVNPAGARLLGRKPEELSGQPLADIFRLVNRESNQPGNDPIDRAIAADDPLPLISEDALVASDPAAAPRPIVWTARAVRDPEGNSRSAVIVFRDPEEMSLTPEELVKANRFESLGLLAGGIAHDFNNLLTTILGGVSLAKDNRDYTALEDSEKACLTAKGLTKQLLAFAKGGAGTQSVVASKEILDDAVKIAAAGTTAEVVVTVPEGTEPVRVDRAQILQVFQNLVVNALQAMPPPPHQPRVQLQAGNATLAAEQVPPLPPGDYVQFEVRDNANGIPPENLEKIFDPFFTTKKHGTGLGLATVLSIVRKHGGQVGVASTVGAGTAFTIFLPRADAPVEVQARKAPSLRFGTGRVLFMDDDPKIAALTGTMLQSLDYKYDIAKNGDEAIVFYKRYLNIGRPYDAVIMDITVIGGMGGEECFKVLRELDPDVRAIVSSGYDNEDMARRFLDMGFCGYLTKPYRVTDLGKILKTVLT
ncbi:MAG TPA: PAS domain-containing protein [Opitutus sp.]|nr:PAS domain-containing protein [Opitutus sp.]